MKKFVLQRIAEYSDYFRRDLPYFRKDGTVMNEINLSFNSLCEEYLQSYEQLSEHANQNGQLAQETENLKTGLDSVISKMKIDDAELKDLLLFLANTTTYSGAIIITNQKISDETSVRISNILKANKVNIDRLDLSDNIYLNRDSGIALGDALKINKSLRSLNLSKTDLKKDGTNRVIEALRSNNSIQELHLGLIGDSSLNYMIDFLNSNTSITSMGFEENPEEEWKPETTKKFLAMCLKKHNQMITSFNVKTEKTIKHRIFLGELAIICEKNRSQEIEELENVINEGDYNEPDYYCTEKELVFSKVFSIKSYVNNVFGSLLEEGIYKLEKERLDLIKRRNIAMIENKHFAENSSLLTCDGSILELAKYLYAKFKIGGGVSPQPSQAQLQTQTIKSQKDESAKTTISSPTHQQANPYQERTFLMIKPDGLQRDLVGELTEELEGKGFKLVGMKMMKPSEKLLKEHYAELVSKSFFPELLQFMMSGPVMAMVWEGHNVVTLARKILGKTNNLDADPGSVRGSYAMNVRKNIMHGSDSVENATREINLWFQPGELVDWNKSDAKWVNEK